MFDRIPNAPSIRSAVNLSCRQTVNAWNMKPQAGVQGSIWGSIKLKQFYMQRFRNPPCGTLTGSYWIAKNWVGVPPGFIQGWGMQGESEISFFQF